MILEKEYVKTTMVNHRKKFAQFFTPEPIAKIMCNWLLQDNNFSTLLEPAFGLGIFSRIILNNKPNVDITGFDVDKTIYNTAKNNFINNNNIKLFLEDYLFNDWNNKYDRIICNPPYLKFHDYENKKTLDKIKKKLNFHLTGFTNIYTLFLLKSIYQLKENGRIAYIIPSEFLNSDYGKKIKEYLVKSNILRHIIIFDFKENVFDNAQTTSSILLLAKDKHKKNIQFSVVSNQKELNFINTIIDNYPKSSGQILISTDTIEPNVKWRKYYQKQQSIKYRNLIPFNHVAKVIRGIATGANNYFIFNAEKAKQYNIQEENLLPCITKSKDVNKPIFTKSDFIALKNNNAKIFLFDGIKNQDKNTLKYIKLGEEKGIHEKYLTSKRNPWYSLENRPPSPIWVGVFYRKGLKFVRNEAGISNLTTFHCIYSINNLFNKINIDLLFAYLLTDIAQKIFNDNRREYGDGLKKFEPNDLNNALMLDLSILDKDTEKLIIELYNEYKISVLNNSEDRSKINEINEQLRKIYEV